MSAESDAAKLLRAGIEESLHTAQMKTLAKGANIVGSGLIR